MPKASGSPRFVDYGVKNPELLKAHNMAIINRDLAALYGNYEPLQELEVCADRGPYKKWEKRNDTKQCIAKVEAIFEKIEQGKLQFERVQDLARAAGVNPKWFTCHPGFNQKAKALVGFVESTDVRARNLENAKNLLADLEAGKLTCKTMREFCRLIGVNCSWIFKHMDLKDRIDKVLTRYKGKNND